MRSSPPCMRSSPLQIRPRFLFPTIDHGSPSDGCARRAPGGERGAGSTIGEFPGGDSTDSGRDGDAGSLPRAGSDEGFTRGSSLVSGTGVQRSLVVGEQEACLTSGGFVVSARGGEGTALLRGRSTIGESRINRSQARWSSRGRTLGRCPWRRRAPSYSGPQARSNSRELWSFPWSQGWVSRVRFGVARAGSGRWWGFLILTTMELELNSICSRVPTAGQGDEMADGWGRVLGSGGGRGNQQGEPPQPQQQSQQQMQQQHFLGYPPMEKFPQMPMPYGYPPQLWPAYSAPVMYPPPDQFSQTPPLQQMMSLPFLYGPHQQMMSPLPQHQQMALPQQQQQQQLGPRAGQQGIGAGLPLKGGRPDREQPRRKPVQEALRKEGGG